MGAIHRWIKLYPFYHVKIQNKITAGLGNKDKMQKKSTNVYKRCMVAAISRTRRMMLTKIRKFLGLLR
jgi:hypothetical protein